MERNASVPPWNVYKIAPLLFCDVSTSGVAHSKSVGGDEAKDKMAVVTMALRV